MITIVAKHFIKDDKIAEFLDMAKGLVDTTKQEDGCMKYDLYQDVKNPKVISIIEEWGNSTALDRHSSSEHFRRIVPILSGFTEKQTEINIYKKVE